MSEYFEKAFEAVIGHEGGYTDHNSDKGGETKYGISKRSYPQHDIKNLTMDEAKYIYYRDFYDPLYDELSEEVAIELFDTGVNMGVRMAVRMFQEALNLLNRNGKNFPDLVVDGYIGRKTIFAYSLVNKKRLMKALNGLQFKRYVAIVQNDPKQEVFFNGWLERV